MANRTKPGARVPVEQLIEAEHQLALTQLVLQAATTEEPYTTQRVHYDGWTYTFKLFRPTSPNGGIVLQIARRAAASAKQKPSVTAHYLDDLFALYNQPHTRDYLSFWPVMHELRFARERACETERLHTVSQR